MHTTSLTLALNSILPLADKMRIFSSIKRLDHFRSIEPMFIGTRKEPLFDERLSIEGMSDKMTQVIVATRTIGAATRPNINISAKSSTSFKFRKQTSLAQQL